MGDLIKAMHEYVEEMIEKRQESNLELLDILKKIVEKHPELRFGQILIIAGVLEMEKYGGVVDPFNEESFRCLQRVKWKLKEKDL